MPLHGGIRPSNQNTDPAPAEGALGFRFNWDTALVFKRLVLMVRLPLVSAAPDGALTSCTTSMNTTPSWVTRGRTFRIVPVSRYCT